MGKSGYDSEVGTNERGRRQKNIFKQLFQDGWEDFKKRYPRYEVVDEVVQKMLGCGEYENGYAEYICPECFREKRVPFSCKSSFCCLSCAKTYTTNWVETVQNMLHEGVTYRHLILTVPAGLRVWFYRYPAELSNGLMKIAAPMMNDVVSTAKEREVELGYIMVLQTAGQAANYNPHLPIIMTGGGLDDQEQWLEVGYLPYSILHKKWQYYLFGMVKEVLGDHPEVVRLIDELWRQYPQGLVAHLKETAVPKVAGLARYVAKYVVSPPMPLSRLMSYDRQTGGVRYGYEDHQHGKQEVELSRDQFIGRMVQHILPKGFKRVRYYGLQATCKLKRVAEVLKGAIKRVVQGTLGWLEQVPVKAVVKVSYRARMKRAYAQDPFICDRCGAELWLGRLWHPEYGVIYDDLEAIKAGKYDPPLAVGPPEIRNEPEQFVQIPLFEMPNPFVYA